MNFNNIKDWIIPEGTVEQVIDGQNRAVWHKEQPPMDNEYFYVEDISGNDNTLSIVKGRFDCPAIEVFYSTDKVNWTSMGSTDTTPITATIPYARKMYLKATVIRWGNEMYNGNKITCSGNYNVGGNIMSLLNGDNFEGTSLAGVSREFQYLFDNSTTLVNAKYLVFPNNTDYACYREMFRGCTSLVSVSTYANGNLASNCLDNWLNGVAAHGDFYNLGTATYPTDSASGIPSGWTEHNSL